MALSFWGRPLENRWNKSEVFYELGHDSPSMQSRRLETQAGGENVLYAIHDCALGISLSLPFRVQRGGRRKGEERIRMLWFRYR